MWDRFWGVGLSGRILGCGYVAVFVHHDEAGRHFRESQCCIAQVDAEMRALAEKFF